MNELEEPEHNDRKSRRRFVFIFIGTTVVLLAWIQLEQHRTRLEGKVQLMALKVEALDGDFQQAKRENERMRSILDSMFDYTFQSPAMPSLINGDFSQGFTGWQREGSGWDNDHGGLSLYGNGVGSISQKLPAGTYAFSVTSKCTCNTVELSINNHRSRILYQGENVLIWPEVAVKDMITITVGSRESNSILTLLSVEILSYKSLR